jgi:hypothetical protein
MCSAATSGRSAPSCNARSNDAIASRYRFASYCSCASDVHSSACVDDRDRDDRALGDGGTTTVLGQTSPAGTCADDTLGTTTATAIAISARITLRIVDLTETAAVSARATATD